MRFKKVFNKRRVIINSALKTAKEIKLIYFWCKSGKFSSKTKKDFPQFHDSIKTFFSHLYCFMHISSKHIFFFWNFLLTQLNCIINCRWQKENLLLSNVYFMREIKTKGSNRRFQTFQRNWLKKYSQVSHKAKRKLIVDVLRAAWST